MSAEPKGYRRDIMAFRDVSELMEKYPDLDRPGSISFHDGSRRISWWLYRGYADLDMDYWRKTQEERNTIDRLEMERRMGGIVDALNELSDVPLEWEKNDPSKDAYSYSLMTEWKGFTVQLSCARDTVCEKVTVLETSHVEQRPDPEWVQKAPTVDVVVKDIIEEWQCNETLGEKTMPRYVGRTEVMEAGAE